MFVYLQGELRGVLEHLVTQLLNGDVHRSIGWIHRIDLFAHLLKSLQATNGT